MDENKKIICCTNNYLGIGNRLKYLISCLRYYDNPDIIHLIWPSSGWVNCKFKDLFVFNIKTVIKEYEEPNENETISQDLPTNWRLWISPNDHLPRNIKNDDPLDKDILRIDFLYNKIPQNIIDIYQAYFSKLSPTEPVKEIMKTANVKPSMVAVQIRDNNDWSDNGRTLYIKQFIKEMKKYPKNTIFFVSTMNKEVMDIIQHNFLNQIVAIPNKDYTSMEYSVADLFLLGIPNQALCSCGSTFYEVAWWLGGSKAKVTTIGNYKNWIITPKSKFTQFITSIKNYLKSTIKKVLKKLINTAHCSFENAKQNFKKK